MEIEDTVPSETENISSQKTEKDDLDMDAEDGEVWAPRLFRELDQERLQLPAAAGIAESGRREDPTPCGGG